LKPHRIIQTLPVYKLRFFAVKNSISGFLNKLPPTKGLAKNRLTNFNPLLLYNFASVSADGSKI